MAYTNLIKVLTCFIIYSRTSLNGPITGPTLNGPFMEVVDLWSQKSLRKWNCIDDRFWNPNNVIDMGEWSICGGGRLERIDCISYLPRLPNLTVKL